MDNTLFFITFLAKSEAKKLEQFYSIETSGFCTDSGKPSCER